MLRLEVAGRRPGGRPARLMVVKKEAMNLENARGCREVGENGGM